MVDRFHPCGSGHVLDDNSGLARNVFFQKRYQGAGLHIPRAAWLAASQNGNRFTLVVRRLSEGITGEQPQADDSCSQCCRKRLDLNAHHPPPYCETVSRAYTCMEATVSRLGA